MVHEASLINRNISITNFFMAQTYSLALYSITIHRLGNRNDRLVLTDFDNGISLYDIAYDMLCSIKYKKEIEQEKANLSQKNDTTEKRFFRIMKNDNEDILKPRKPYLTGLIESGEYGTEENIVNVETGETKEKKEKDALLRPFYFMLYVPQGAKRAVLILERISNLGIMTVFEKKLIEAVSAKIGANVKDYVVSLEPMALESVLKKHMKAIGGAKKVIFNYVKLSDITPSKLSDGNLNDSEVNSMQLTLNAPRNGSINILSWFNEMKVRFEHLKNKKRTNICSLSDVEYQNVKFEVEIGGASRTISMQDVGKLGTYLDITNEVTLDKNHYPTFASVDQQANIIISDIRQQWENNQ